LAINSTQLVNSIDQIANDFGQYFYNNSNDNNYNLNFLAHKQKCEETNIINTVDGNILDQKQIIEEIKLYELIHTLKKCKSNSPGPDLIPYSFIQNFSIKTLDFLLKIYNRIWKEGIWPKKWKIGIIIPILKPEKS